MNSVRPTIYQPGDRVTVGPHECDIEKRFGNSHTYLCQTPTSEKPLILKYLPYSHDADIRVGNDNEAASHHRVAYAQRSSALFDKTRSSLLAVGIPDMMFCDTVHQLVEYVPGHTVSESTDYSLQDLQHILLQVITQISALMQHGLVHGDLKPENTIISRNGDHTISPRTTLIDFNLMGAAGGDAGVQEKYLIGTPLFMSPEQACGYYRATSDAFSAGIMSLEILSYHVQCGVDFSRVSRNHETVGGIIRDRVEDTWLQPDARSYLEQTLFSQHTVDRRLARGLIEFFLACTRHKYYDRPQSGEEMRQILTDTGNITEI